MQTSSLATATTHSMHCPLFHRSSFQREKALQSWKMRGSLPILGSASFGERERYRTAPGDPFPGPQQCQGHSPRHAFGTAPFSPSSSQACQNQAAPWRPFALGGERTPAARTACAGTHRATGGSGSPPPAFPWQEAPAQTRLPEVFPAGFFLAGRRRCKMPLDFLHSFLPISNQNSWLQP